MERVPKKKARRGLKRGALLLLLAAAAALCGGGIYWLNRPVDVDKLPQAAPQTVLLERSGSEITALGIMPREGEAYPLVLGGDGSFYLPGKSETALRSFATEGMISALHELKAQETILDTRESQIDLSHFGLSPAQVSVTITYQDGEKKRLLIGALSPEEEPQYYCMVEGDSRIYTVLEAFCEPFFYEREYLRAFEQPELDASLMDRIDISGDITLGLYYTPDGWQMDAPLCYPVSSVQSQQLLSAIEGMAFEACLGSAEENDLEQLGLLRPALTVILTQAPATITAETLSGEQVSWQEEGKRYTLLLGNETGKSGVYLMWEGMIYKASNFLLGFWKEIIPEQLLLRTPVNFLTNQLRYISFRCGEYRQAYEFYLVEALTENNEIATDEYGEILYDAAVKRAGEAEYMDAEAFLSWYTALAALAPAGRLPEGWRPPEGMEAEGEILLTSQETARVISFYPYDALHDAMAVDGVCVFYIEKSFLNTLVPLP